MKLSYTFASLVAVASAFPVIDHLNVEAHQKAARLAARTVKLIEEGNRQRHQSVKRAASSNFTLPLPEDALGLSQAETNCGPTIPCPYFDEKEQFVSVEGEYAYADPDETQIRGPCPGLNAAANHGYLPRSGIATLEETVRGLNKRESTAPALDHSVTLSDYFGLSSVQSGY